MRDVIIVGAGAAGLVAAWELRDRDTLVLEASQHVGGRLDSVRRGRYWLNFGGHLFPADDSTTGRVLAEVGLTTTRLRGTPLGVAMGGRVVTEPTAARYALRLPMSARGRASLLRSGAKLMLAGRRAAKRTRADAALPPRERRMRRLRFMGDESFAAFIGTLHPEVHDLLESASARVGASMEEQAAGCGVEHFFSASQGAKSTYLRNLQGGPNQLPATIAAKLPDRVRTGARVLEVADAGDRVRVCVEDATGRSTLEARCAIVATTADVAAEIARDLRPETSAALRSVRYGPFVVVSLLTDEERAMPWDDLYAVSCVGMSFNLFTNQANILRDPFAPRARGGSVMLYASGPFARAHLDRADAEIVEAFLRDATAIFPELRGIVREVVVRRWRHGVPYAAPGRHQLQAGLEAPHPRIALAGDYFDYASMETAAFSAVDAARGVRAALDDVARAPGGARGATAV